MSDNLSFLTIRFRSWEALSAEQQERFLKVHADQTVNGAKSKALFKDAPTGT